MHLPKNITQILIQDFKISSKKSTKPTVYSQIVRSKDSMIQPDLCKDFPEKWEGKLIKEVLTIENIRLNILIFPQKNKNNLRKNSEEK